MPRKPQRKPRPFAGTTPTPAGRSRRDRQTFWQCMACGAVVDSMYGAGDDSWCPSCECHGQIMREEGQLPCPGMYGSWLAWQKREQRERESLAEIDALLKRPVRRKEEESVKVKKQHTGVFHCPRCFIELDLYGEESLRCDQCEGPLAKGSMEALVSDDDEDEE